MCMLRGKAGLFLETLFTLTESELQHTQVNPVVTDSDKSVWPHVTRSVANTRVDIAVKVGVQM